MKKTIIYGLLFFAIYSCGGENANQSKTEEADVSKNTYAELDNKAQQLFSAIDLVADNPNNPVTREKVELGKKLYFDNRLSKDNKQSCNTCHNLNTFGVDNNSFSIGNDGKPGGRNSPTTLNAAFHIAQFWDGREPDVEAQAGGPMLNPVEMAMPDEKTVIARLKKDKNYQELFAKAFPKDKNPINFENVKKSIGAFERKLVTPSKFDDYLKGDKNALNDNEKKGLQTFINAGCIACHSGKLLGGNMYQKFGIYGNYWDFTKSKKIDNGRMDVTKKETDKYVFKVPSLRNIEKTFPYFHDGSVKDLGEAIKIMAKTQSNKELSKEEVDEIIVFLKTLTGKVPENLKQ